MPRRKKFAKKRAPRRRFFRKRRSPVSQPISSISTLSTGRVGLPDRLLCRLRFTDVTQNTTASGSYSEAVYRIIGAYDPRYASGGDYPKYFSQLQALYQYYQVQSARIRVFLNPGGSPALVTSNVEAVVYVSTTAAGSTTIEDAIDERSCKYTTCSVYLPQGTSRLHHTAEPASYLGMSKQKYRDDPATQALTTALPDRILYWIIGIKNNSTDTNAIAVRVMIDYTIEFRGLVPLDKVDSAND